MIFHRVITLSLFVLLLGCQPPQVDTISTVEPSPAAPAAESAEITIGTIETIDSAVLGEERDLWIYLPTAAKDELNPQRYPVVYLLDGNGHFHSVSGMIRQLSTVNGNKKVPEMIVVGIPNTDRMRDLTPTHTEGTTGGGTAFLDFVENEVIPHIEANYPASQYRTFIGHSLGGLMAIEALITRPEVFQNYVAIDPSLWWDEQSVLHRAEDALNEMDFSGKSLFVSIANTMPRGMTLEEVVNDTSDRTRHIRSILQYSKSAEANTRSGLEFEWDYYGDDTHGSVPLISEYDALRFIFPWYDPGPVISDFFNPDLADSPDEAVAALSDHFEMISERFAYEYLPPRNWINSVARNFQFNEKTESELAMLQLNLRNYSAHPAVHEAIGDYYVRQQDMESARLHFQHAIDRGGEINMDEKTALEQSEQ